uniref:Uncharacterized protein n=1 Tax=Anguilla anguilla TaxID=7936 RepID=A0A0E9QJ65_ANGAN
MEASEGIHVLYAIFSLPPPNLLLQG